MVAGHIIISDAAEKSIVSLNSMTEETTILISGHVGKVEGMDVDPYGHNLYWADSERQTVEVLSLHSFERKVLLQDLGGESPIDVAVVPEEGCVHILFYFQKNLIGIFQSRKMLKKLHKLCACKNSSHFQVKRPLIHPTCLFFYLSYGFKDGHKNIHIQLIKLNQRQVAFHWVGHIGLHFCGNL